MDVAFYLNGTSFVWDENKAASDVVNYGLTFEEAAETFFDPFASYGDASPPHEKRAYIIGYTFDRSLLFTVFIERGPAVRIISARVATPRERKLYERGD